MSTDNPHYLRRRAGLLAASVALLLLAAAGALKIYFAKPDLPGALTELQLNVAEPGVAAKIRSLLAQVEKNPGSAEAWGTLAMNLDIHDFKRESIPCYQRATELDPAEFRWPYYAAITLSEMGSPDAIRWFEKCQALNPDYLPFHILFGLELLKLGRMADAAKAFQQALMADPNAAYAYLGLARMALFQDDLEASRRHLLKAAELDPQQGETHRLLAEVYQRLNEPEKAAGELQKSLAFSTPKKIPDPLYAALAMEGVSSYWYLMRGQNLVTQHRFAEAAEEFSLSLKAKARAEAHNGLGFALYHLGNYAEAATHYRAAIALNPDYRDATFNLATTLYATGDVQESILKLRDVVRLDSSFTGAYLNLGTYLLSSGQAPEAIAALRQGLERAPFDTRIANKLAWLLATSAKAASRDGKEALLLAEKVCRLTDYRVPQDMDILAAAYAESRQFQKAVDTARQAHRLAVSAGLLDLAGGIESRLKLYEMKRPFHVNPF